LTDLRVISFGIIQLQISTQLPLYALIGLSKPCRSPQKS